jgi:hypothetical protein
MSEGPRGADREDAGSWGVRLTTNMSISESGLDGITEVIENPDGTTTYVMRLDKPPSTDK